MSTYHMYCTVCKSFFENAAEWSTHLPEIGHQRRARLACRRWNKSTKDCVLVAFGSCAIADCDLVGRLSWGNSLVTDFVWWKKKPNVGLVQFESRKILEDVLQRTTAEVNVDGTNRVQLKRASDYLELEWNVMLSLKVDARMEPEEEPTNCDLYDSILNEVKQEMQSTNESCDEVVAKETKRRTLSKRSNEGNDGTIGTPKKTKKSRNKPLEDDESGSQITATPSKKSKKGKPSRNSDDFSIVSNKKKKDKVTCDKDKDPTGGATPKKAKKVKTSSPHDKERLKKQKRPNPILDGDSEELPMSHPTCSNEIPIQALNEVQSSNNADNPNPQISCITDNINTVPELPQCNLNVQQSTQESTSDGATQNAEVPVTEISNDYDSAHEDNGNQEVNNSPFKKENYSNPTTTTSRRTEDNECEMIILSSDSDNDEGNECTDHCDQTKLIETDDIQIITNVSGIARDKDVIEDSMRSWKAKLADDIQRQYVSLFKDILIPSDIFQVVTNLTEMMESEFKKTVPWCKVIPFRHWYLGIKNCGSNELLLFLDYRRIWEQDKWDERSCSKPPIISTFFRSPEEIFPDIEKLPKMIKSSDINQNEESYGVGFLHKPTGLKFRIITSVFLLHEVQTCLLVKYLCQFDRSVLPLLGLVNYWANLNSLSFGNFRITDPSKPTISPLPASLDWLVLLYLMERKIIPSARDILERPHDKIIICNKDIGFSSDPEFPKTWSSLPTQPLQVHEQIERMRNTDDSEVYSVNHALFMLENLRGFFAFFSRYRSTRVRKKCEVVLNTKDGNIIKTSAIMKGSQKLTLSKEEIITLRNVSCLTGHQVSIIHPIDLRFSLSFCGGKFSYMLTHAMNRTAKKLAEFFHTLKMRRKIEGEGGIDLVELLKVDEVKVDRSIADPIIGKQIKTVVKTQISKKKSKKKMKKKGLRKKKKLGIKRKGMNRLGSNKRTIA